MNLHAVGHKHCDWTDCVAITALVRKMAPDLVSNAVACNALDQAESDEAAARESNFTAVAALVAAHRGKLVHVSSDIVFDGLSSRAYQPGDLQKPLSADCPIKAEGKDRQRTSDIFARIAWLYPAGGKHNRSRRAATDAKEARAQCGRRPDRRVHLGYRTGADDLGAGCQGCQLHVPSQRRQHCPPVRFRFLHPGRGAGTGSCPYPLAQQLGLNVKEEASHG